MAAMRTGLVRSAVSDLGLADDEGRTAVGPDGFGQDGVNLHDVIGIVAAKNAPVVGGVAGGDVLGKREAGVAFDGDVVVVVEHDEIVEFEVTGEAGGLGSVAFHHAAVAADHEDAALRDVRLVKADSGRKLLGGDRHADRGTETAAQRTGRDVDALGVAEFRMARSQAAPLTEVLQFVHGEAVVEEMQEGIDQHGAVSGGQHETVASDPGRIGGIMAEIFRPEDHGEIGVAHRHAGVSGFGLLNRFGGQNTDCVSGFFQHRLLKSAGKQVQHRIG